MEEIKFELTKEQTKKYLAWRKKLPKLPQDYWGCNGGGFIFSFIPTSIGVIDKVRRDDDEGNEIDLTEYEHF